MNQPTSRLTTINSGKIGTRAVSFEMYFRPRVHDDDQRPHHCALVDAAFGDRTIREDCPEHQVADEHLAEQNWKKFTNTD